MIEFENVVDIRATPEIVFAYLADLRHVPEWNWAISSTEQLTTGPAAIGTRYLQRRAVPQPSVEFLEITGLDPARFLEVAGKLGPFDARVSYVIAPSSVGTRVVNRVELTSPLLLGPLAGIATARIRGSVADNLDMLRRRLEGSASRAVAPTG